jgi:uncharacterized YccA/Bax inhibitor family protein
VPNHPVLNKKTFWGEPRSQLAVDRMTLAGTVNKTFLLLAVLLVSALWPWSQYSSGDLPAATGVMLVGLLGGFVLSLMICFTARWAPYLALPYAVCEGLVLGGLSAVFERRYPGIAIQAVGATFAVLAVMLVAYRAGIIRATERFRAIVIGATGAIALFYLVVVVLSYFHIDVPVLNAATPLGIGISLVIVAIAASNLVLDFDQIESGVQQGAPRYMEWYSAFGLLVTLVWLYLEVIRLLSKVRRS